MRMSVRRALSSMLSFFVTTVLEGYGTAFTPLNCGREKVLTEEKGIIQTPNFPHPFRVPIRCRWVIDASNYTSAGNKEVEIYVYMTQLYTTIGLTMTEYQFYSSETKIGYSGSKLLQQPTPSDYEIQRIRTNLKYLAIDYELDMLEGNHVRSLYNLMDVFGFNMTYEISMDGERTGSCTVNDCSLSGHCYASADFSSYNCSCFKGFHGETCGYGPLCESDKYICANGASCRHVGELMVSCALNDELYVANKCRNPAIPNATNPDTIYAIQCPIDGRTENSRACSCSNPECVYQAVERIHYIVNVSLGNITWPSNRQSIVNPNINTEYLVENRILDEIEKYVRKAKLSKFESLSILNITKDSGINSISYHFLTSRSDENKVKSAFDSIKQKKVIPNIFYQSEIYYFQLLMVSSNANRNIVGQNEEFVLTCIARGSPFISFQWYKDGIPINVTMATRGMWSRTQPYSADKYSSVLSIDKAEPYDTGEYTCRVKDWQREQCNSVYVTVRQAAQFRMRPLYATVNKGDNLTVLCLLENHLYSAYDRGYIWAKDGKLIKMDVPNLFYEDLYLGGSVLHVNNISTSAKFSCNSASMQLDVLDPSRTPYCMADGVWNTTTPNAVALRECPDNYSGSGARRLCSMTDTHKAKWQTADFSSCVSNTFTSITDGFYKLTLGYQNDLVKVSRILMALWSFLAAKRLPQLLPGEGESVVNFLKLVYDFLSHSKLWHEFHAGTPYFFNLVDLLLQDTTSLLSEKVVGELCDLIEKWISLWTLLNYNRGAVHANRRSFFVGNSSYFKSFELRIAQIQREATKLHHNVSVNIDFLSSNTTEEKTLKIAIMVYQNISSFLLPKYVSNEESDNQFIYELMTPVVHLWITRNPFVRHTRDANSTFSIRTHVDFLLPRKPFEWNMCCGIISSFGSTWHLHDSQGALVSNQTLRCSSNRTGLFAIFVSTSSKAEYEKNQKYQLVAFVGCAFCFLLCIWSLCILLFQWLKLRSCVVYLKIQICASTAFSMLLFLYSSCDPTTEMYPYILSGLQMFLLTSISSHISILIVMYVELVSLCRTPNINISAIAVITVSPVLLIFFTSLNRKINEDEKVSCWWLRRGTLLFYINFIVSLIMVLLFVFFYSSVIRKLFFLWNATEGDRQWIIQRLSFLHYTAFVFLTTLLMIISSMLYVNISTSTSHCLFGSSCILLGVMIFICYIPKCKPMVWLKILYPSLKRSNSKYSPNVKVNSKSGGIPRDVDTYETESLNSISATIWNGDNLYLNVFDSKQTLHPVSHLKEKKSVAFPEVLVTGVCEAVDIEETCTDAVIDSSENSNHNATNTEISPVSQHSNYATSEDCGKNDRCCSPPHQQLHEEMLTTRVCVELGLMRNHKSNGDTPMKNGSTVVICSVDVEPCPGHIVELNEVKFTANTIGAHCSSEGVQKTGEHCDESAILNKNSDKADVLERISQDLDYLLNRSPSPGRTQKNIKITANGRTKLIDNNRS